MKKRKLNQRVQDFIACLGITVFMITILSCMSWNVKVTDERMIQEEIQKKTEMSGTHISQNEILQK